MCVVLCVFLVFCCGVCVCVCVCVCVFVCVCVLGFVLSCVCAHLHRHASALIGSPTVPSTPRLARLCCATAPHQESEISSCSCVKTVAAVLRHCPPGPARASPLPALLQAPAREPAPAGEAGRVGVDCAAETRSEANGAGERPRGTARGEGERGKEERESEKATGPLEGRRPRLLRRVRSGTASNRALGGTKRAARCAGPGKASRRQERHSNLGQCARNHALPTSLSKPPRPASPPCSPMHLEPAVPQ